MGFLDHHAWRRRALILSAAMLFLTAVPASAQAEYAHVRFAHLVANGNPVDVFLDGERIVEALRFGQASEYRPLDHVSAIATIVPAGGAESDSLLTTSLAFAAGDTGFYTVALVPGGESLLAVSLPADGVPAATGAASVGDLSISGAYVRATATGAGQTHAQGGVTAAYLTIQNDAETGDRLVSVEADAAARVEIHETTIEDDVASMHMLPDGLEIGAGESAELKPGGLHLMLMGLSGPLTPGQAVRLTLTFESGAVAVVRAPVRMP